jgi:hypothetical protein
MLPKPQVGQKVRVEKQDGVFVVKTVSADGGQVDLVSANDKGVELTDIPCLDLLLAEGEDPE